MRNLRIVGLLVAALAVALGVGGCKHEVRDPEPVPSEPAAPTTTSPAPSSPHQATSDAPQPSTSGEKPEAAATPPAPVPLRDIQTIIANVRAFDPENPGNELAAFSQLYPEAEMEALQAFIKQQNGAAELRNQLEPRLQMIATCRKILRDNEVSSEILAKQEAARTAIWETHKAFFEALTKRDIKAMASLIDIEQYQANLEGKGTIFSKGKKPRAPSNHKTELKYTPDEVKPDGTKTQATYQLVYGDAYTAEELLDVGLKYLCDRYGSPKSTFTFKGKPGAKGELVVQVFGAPVLPLGASGEPDKYYRADFTYSHAGNHKPLDIHFCGEWGKPAKVFMIFDQTSTWYRDHLAKLDADRREQEEYDRQAAEARSQPPKPVPPQGK